MSDARAKDPGVVPALVEEGLWAPWRGMGKREGDPSPGTEDGADLSPKGRGWGESPRVTCRAALPAGEDSARCAGEALGYFCCSVRSRETEAGLAEMEGEMMGWDMGFSMCAVQMC
jgi:hypothetical protein